MTCIASDKQFEPVGIVSSQAGDFKAEQQTDLPQGDHRRHACESASPIGGGAGQPEILVHHRDPIGILPAFGALLLDRVGPDDMAEWFDAARRDKPGAANRAFEILRAMMNRAEEWCFRERGTNPCVGIRKNSNRNIARFLDRDELAQLGKVRLHDLRHTAASHAVMSGENLPQVGKLLGHRRHETTALYAHLADGHLVEAAEKVGQLIAKAMVT